MSKKRNAQQPPRVRIPTRGKVRLSQAQALAYASSIDDLDLPTCTQATRKPHNPTERGSFSIGCALALAIILLALSAIIVLSWPSLPDSAHYAVPHGIVSTVCESLGGIAFEDNSCLMP